MGTSDPGVLRIEVAYAEAGQAVIIPLEVRPGTTIREAVTASGIAGRCPAIDLQFNRVGVYGRLRGLDEAVQAGDRIEIYRPLQADPGQARRRRARQQRSGGH